MGARARALQPRPARLKRVRRMFAMLTHGQADGSGSCPRTRPDRRVHRGCAQGMARRGALPPACAWAGLGAGSGRPGRPLRTCFSHEAAAAPVGHRSKAGALTSAAAAIDSRTLFGMRHLWLRVGRSERWRVRRRRRRRRMRTRCCSRRRRWAWAVRLHECALV